MTIKEVIPEDKLYILQQGEREHVIFAKFLQGFVLVLGGKKNAGLLFNTSIRKVSLFLFQIRQKRHPITLGGHLCSCLKRVRVTTKVIANSIPRE